MRRALIAFAALRFTAPAAAQDGSEVEKARTPESAQEFLSVTSTDPPVGFQLIDSWTRNYQSSMRFMGTYPDQPCSTKFVGTLRYEIFSAAEQRWKDRVQEGFEYPIYWKHAAKVSQEGRAVRINWKNLTPVLVFYSSDDLARRAASAMEFLRLQCDPTANLAF